MSGLRAGELNRRVTIQSKTVTQDPTNGSSTVSWSDYLSNIAAQFEYLLPARSEVVTHQVKMDSTQARLRVRWRQGVDSSMRVVLHGSGDTLWQIVGGPSEIEGHRVGLEMYLEQYTTTGDEP